MTRSATTADYARLGLGMTATTAEIKSAFRQLALRQHPDVNPGDAGAAKRFALLVESYEAVLAGPAPALASAPQRTVTVRRPFRPARIRPDERPLPLASVAAGQTLWTDYSAILIAPDRRCYLDPAAMGRHHVDGGTALRIEHGRLGYVVTLPPGCRHRFSVSPEAASMGLAVEQLDCGEGTLPEPLLPARFLDATIGAMSTGARGWTVAGALVVKQDGSCFIDADEHLNEAPTMITPVRVERRADGWHVVADGHPQQWASQKRSVSETMIELASARLGGIDVKPLPR